MQRVASKDAGSHAVATAGAVLVEELFWILLIPAVVAGAVGVIWQRQKS